MWGCKTPGEWRTEADDATYAHIATRQIQALGRAEAFTIERPADTLRRRLMLGQTLPHAAPSSLSTKDIEPIEQWPEDGYLDAPDDPALAPPWSGNDVVELSLDDALMIGARNSREYQTEKEAVFRAGLALDLELDQFRDTWFGLLNSAFINDEFPSPTERGVENSGELSMLKQLENGAAFGLRIGFDLAKLLTGDKSSSWGFFADATISIPLLRGSGEFVVTEPLTQADRDVVYAIYRFERFKRIFAVDVASAYLGVLQQQDAARNAEDYYSRLISGTRGATRRAQAGDLPEIQVDQAKQDELNARNLWIVELQEYERRLDGFKILLGLPTDAQITLLDDELAELVADATAEFNLDRDYRADTDVPPADAPIVLRAPGTGDAGPLEMEPGYAVITAIENRLDLRTAVGRVFDSQRVVAVAADNLRADLTLLGSAGIGARRTLSDAGLSDADLRFDDGTYSAIISLDLPFERTAERNLYRESLILLEETVRGVQTLEDTIKFEVRDALRILLESRETLVIQAESVALAQRRVRSTGLFLQAGRADIRDVLEAQEDLLDAQNLFTAALVRYRIAELELQRDLGLLAVDGTGAWREFRPEGGSQQPGGDDVAAGALGDPALQTPCESAF